MCYKDRIVELLKEYMTEKSFILWCGIDRILPNVWDKPTSSTGKHHKKRDGSIPSQAEHVYQMLYAAIKIIKLFGIQHKTKDCDKILFAIVLHDSLKYGTLGTRLHTDTRHDRAAADMVASNKETFLKLFDENQFNIMEECLRFHSGKWSTDAKNMEFNFNKLNPETLLIHILDMLSTADLIQTDVRE